MPYEKVKVEIFLDKETIERINDIVQFGKFKSKFSKYDLPTNEQIVIKAALAEYFEKIERLNELYDSSGLNDLGKPHRVKNRFKETIRKKGMKQIDLSEKTGIDNSNLSMILNNKTQPSLDYFLRIWITLGCPNIEDILYREKEKD